MISCLGLGSLGVEGLGPAGASMLPTGSGKMRWVNVADKVESPTPHVLNG